MGNKSIVPPISYVIVKSASTVEHKCSNCQLIVLLTFKYVVYCLYKNVNS